MPTETLLSSLLLSGNTTVRHRFNQSSLIDNCLIPQKLWANILWKLLFYQNVPEIVSYQTLKIVVA